MRVVPVMHHCAISYEIALGVIILKPCGGVSNACGKNASSVFR
jgi:hypothetical protein